MIQINIDGREILTHPGYTIKQVAEQNGIDIPTLCFDEKLKNYGSCGLCVVEVEGNPKLVRSCSTEIMDGMVVHSHSERIRESRKTTLELFISDHTGDCKAPCTLGCPDHVDIQAYVGLTGNGEHLEALKVIKKDLPLPASIGRVCPHPCMTECRRQYVDDPIHIAWIKRHAADYDLALEHPWMPECKPDSGKRIAIVGGGPCGLSAAYFLRQEGHGVTIYEANSEMGGMLHYGIPMYRLPKDVLKAEADLIRDMGTEFITNTRLGKDVSLDYLRDNYDAVLLAVGMWNSTPLRVPGEDLEGVRGGIHFLYDFVTGQPLNIGERVAVIGGGNTAMDAARTAVRLGAKEVNILYRRGRDDMPAEEIEILEAQEEGVNFHYGLSPLEVVGENGKVTGIRLQKMRIIPPADENSRSSIEPIEGEEDFFEVDSVLVATGQGPKLDGLEELSTDRRGFIAVGENTFQTSIPGVFAAGDVIERGKKIGIQAIADAKHASGVIHTYLQGEMVPFEELYYVTRPKLSLQTIMDEHPGLEVTPQSHMGHMAPMKRRDNFEEVVAGYTLEEAKQEGLRCLECGCMDYAECNLFERSNEYKISPERIAGEKNAIEYSDEHPFIIRDPNKCIVCGMCVRVCDEVMDNTALGLVERGFGVTVKPAMEKPLSETDCISCGQCVAVCPVGALQEKRPDQKQVPLEGKTVRSTCFGCSVGCAQDVESQGPLLLRTLPVAGDRVSAGLLCEKGRFLHEPFHPSTRLMQAMTRRAGELEECSFDDALLRFARGAQSHLLTRGEGSLAISVAPHYTNEEIYLIKKFAREYLGFEEIYSLSYQQSGLRSVLGVDASLSKFEEMEKTNMIITLGGDLYNSHTMAALRLRTAKKNGALLADVNPESTKTRSWADVAVELPVKDVLEGMLEPENAPQEVKDLAEKYAAAKKAILVYDRSALSFEEEELLAKVAVKYGHVGSIRSGIVQLKSALNAQGLVDIADVLPGSELLEKIDSGQVSGVLLFGEDLPKAAAEKLEFLAVHSAKMNDSVYAATVVLPAATLSESEGLITSTERRIAPLRRVFETSLAMDNFQSLAALASSFGQSAPTREEVREAIAREYPAYLGIQRKDFTGGYWPLGKDPVLYKENLSLAGK